MRPSRSLTALVFLLVSLLVATCDRKSDSSLRDGAAGRAKTAAPNSKPSEPPEPEISGASPAGTPDTETDDTKAPKTRQPPVPEPPNATADPKFTLALRSGDALAIPHRLTDGTIVIHGAGHMARVIDGALVNVAHSGPHPTMEGRGLFLDHFGGRWPEPVFSCWMDGLPNHPRNPELLRFERGKGWRKVGNGRGAKRWCYEGFAAGSDGSLVSRKIAHDFEEERFALGPFVSDARRPGFSVIEGTGSVANPKLPHVADWAMSRPNEIWAVTGSDLVRLPSDAPRESFPLPEAVARRSSKPLRVTYDEGTLYVHGESRDGAYLARWGDGALEPIDLPEAIEGTGIAVVDAMPNGDLWILAGRILWQEIQRGTMWHHAGGEWTQIEPRDSDHVDSEVETSVAQYESITGFVIDGNDLWVGLRTFRYGKCSSVVLTTRPVDEEITWKIST